jgi:hypothetical protein
MLGKRLRHPEMVIHCGMLYLDNEAHNYVVDKEGNHGFATNKAMQDQRHPTRMIYII